MSKPTSFCKSCTVTKRYTFDGTYLDLCRDCWEREGCTYCGMLFEETEKPLQTQKGEYMIERWHTDCFWEAMGKMKS